MESYPGQGQSQEIHARMKQEVTDSLQMFDTDQLLRYIALLLWDQNNPKP